MASVSWLTWSSRSSGARVRSSAWQTISTPARATTPLGQRNHPAGRRPRHRRSAAAERPRRRTLWNLADRRVSAAWSAAPRRNGSAVCGLRQADHDFGLTRVLTKIG
ncbi:hypothetical protein [Alloactinosynnema sp. L-07]|nr:hypothetical protein [Alloactinosynnema sp. L-07]CRK62238.1 hypothetical protein [Alloactinosynnema sp. L-07]